MDLVDPAPADPTACAPATTPAAGFRWQRRLAAVLIVLAGLAAYSNSFWGPFIFDDILSIPDNPSIRRLTSLGQVLSPPRAGETVSGRPMLNLSLAIDYAICGTQTWGYHVTNLAIHLLNGLLLFEILRRTFRLPSLAGQFGRAGCGVAWAIALLWTVHPLQTESVTYIVQRAESLATMFYLLTILCVIVGSQAHRPMRWHVLAVVACILGLASKEIVVSVPLVVLLYDRMFLTGSWRETWRRRYGLYLGLAATWLALAVVMAIRADVRGGVIGFGLGITVWEYLCAQCAAILRYVRLSFWPTGLCLDYGRFVPRYASQILPGALLVLGLVSAAGWALLRRSWTGFLAAFFLAVLAPTSSFVPSVSQTIAEHRMYLPLAAIVTLVVIVGYFAGRGLVRRGWMNPRTAATTGICLAVSAAVVLGVLTFRRNEVYRSDISIWLDTVAKVPFSFRAHKNLGRAMLEAKIKLDQVPPDSPAYVEAQYNLGHAAIKEGRLAEAVSHLQEAVRVCPDYAEAHNSLGATLIQLNRLPEGIDHLEQTLRINPDNFEARNNLALTLPRLGRTAEAIDHLEKMLRLWPEDGTIHNAWGNILLSQGQFAEAIEHYRKALACSPDDASAHCNLGSALHASGRTQEAVDEFHQALRIQPDHLTSHGNLGNILLSQQRFAEAIAHFQEVTRRQPRAAQAQFNLSVALSRIGDTEKAIEHGCEAARLMPDEWPTLEFVAWLAATHETSKEATRRQAVQWAERACAQTNRRSPPCLDTLAAAYASMGRFDEAVAAAQEARRLAEAAGLGSLAEDIHMRLQLYRHHKPYREPARPVKGRL